MHECLNNDGFVAGKWTLEIMDVFFLLSEFLQDFFMWETEIRCELNRVTVNVMSLKMC